MHSNIVHLSLGKLLLACTRAGQPRTRGIMSRSTCVRLSNEGRVGAFNGELSTSSMYTQLQDALSVTFAMGYSKFRISFGKCLSNRGFHKRTKSAIFAVFLLYLPHMMPVNVKLDISEYNRITFQGFVDLMVRVPFYWHSWKRSWQYWHSCIVDSLWKTLIKLIEFGGGFLIWMEHLLQNEYSIHTYGVDFKPLPQNIVRQYDVSHPSCDAVHVLEFVFCTTVPC